jgi:predicted RNA binding protein YcfA (HicA-like mRNA interferase family)
MGHDLPMVTAREMVAVLEKLGFRLRPCAATGHRRYVHPDGRRTTIPFHAGGDIGRGLLRKILNDMEVTSEELKRLL